MAIADIQRAAGYPQSTPPFVEDQWKIVADRDDDNEHEIMRQVAFQLAHRIEGGTAQLVCRRLFRCLTGPRDWVLQLYYADLSGVPVDKISRPPMESSN